MSNTSTITQPDKFQKTFDEFFDVMGTVITDLNNNGKTNLNVSNVAMVRQFILSLDKTYLINTFIEKSNTYWDSILKKDDDFFVNNSNKVFGDYANMSEFNALKIIFSKNKDGISLVDDDTKEAVRDYLYALIKISIVHVFNSKEPKVEKNGYKVSITYGKKNAFPNINIIENIKNWEIKLW